MVIELKSGKTSVFDTFCVCLSVGSGFGCRCPCPPIRNDIVTPPHLFYRNIFNLTGGVGPCHGDSGGPAVAGGLTADEGLQLVGIVSWGHPCAGLPGPKPDADHQPPAVFARVTYFLDWIAENR